MAVVIGSLNVICEWLVPEEKIILPSLSIKLGLIRQFVKSRRATIFFYLKIKFPKLSHAKIKQVVFVGPEIRLLLTDDNFENILNVLELDASFRNARNGQFGKHRTANYKLLVEKLIDSYKLRCDMSLKVHYLHSHLSLLPQNAADVSDEYVEIFYQDISQMGTRYKGKWSPAMLAGFCWFLQR